MNIQLTKATATKLIRKALGLPEALNLTIEIQETVHTDLEIAAILRRIKQEYPDYLRSQKIPAIKALRTRGPQYPEPDNTPVIGLGEAKWAIENLDTAIDNLERYGRIGAV